MEIDSDIKWFRYSGYPIIYDQYTKIKSINNQIKFDSIKIWPLPAKPFPALKKIEPPF